MELQEDFQKYILCIAWVELILGSKSIDTNSEEINLINGLTEFVQKGQNHVILLTFYNSVASLNDIPEHELTHHLRE